MLWDDINSLIQSELLWLLKSLYFLHIILCKKWITIKMLENISIYLSCTFCLVLSLNHKYRSFFAPRACYIYSNDLDYLLPLYLTSLCYWQYSTQKISQGVVRKDQERGSSKVKFKKKLSRRFSSSLTKIFT